MSDKCKGSRLEGRPDEAARVRLPSRKRRWLLGFLSSLFGVVLALLVFQLGVTVANHFFPYFYCYDPDRGWGLRPGVSGWWTREGHAYVKINSQGLRDREHAKAKPSNVFRIAVLGDSYAQATQVPVDKTFWSVMEDRLRSCPALKGKIPEAINFGVDGYGTAQELVTLRRDVWQYDPDVVLLAVFLGNDIRNNSISLETNRCRPFFVVENGKLKPIGPFFSSASYRLWCLARFDYRGVSPFKLIANATQLILNPPRQPSPDYPIEHAISYNIYFPPKDEVWRQAWDVTEALITEIDREVKSHGAILLVATLDTGIQVWPDPEVRQRFMREMGLKDLFYPDDRISQLGRKEGFEVITLARPLQAYAEKHHVFLHGFSNTPKGFGHWNEIGHRVAGELIAERVCEMVARTSTQFQAHSALDSKVTSSSPR